jgi:hypothetical protein
MACELGGEGSPLCSRSYSTKGENKSRINEQKRNVWMAGLVTTMECEGVYSKSGFSKAIDRTTTLSRGRKAQKLLSIMKKSAIFISALCRVKLGRNFSKKIRNSEYGLEDLMYLCVFTYINA